MKLNWAERWVVNNPLRIIEQRIEIGKLVRVMPLRPGSQCLEIGCGRGAAAKIILESFRPACLTVTDLDPDMLDRAVRFIPGDIRGEVALAAADGHDLPFRDSSMDAIFCFGVLHHIPDWRGALGEIERVLKTGGRFFFEELYPGVYQNFITRHILAHPEYDRFQGRDLLHAMHRLRLSLAWSREFRHLGILGIAVKNGTRR